MSDIETQINELIAGLSAKDMRAILSEVRTNTIHKVDTSRRARSIAITDLYFSVAPLPHKTDYEEYKLESEAIRQQCLSGVDIDVVRC
jgi:hypothetical protein